MDDEQTLGESFHTDRKDPAVWLVKQPNLIGRAHRRWFVLHRHSRILAYYSKSFIPPAKAPLKGKILLSEVTSVDCIGKRMEIGVAKGRNPFRLAADDEKTARDWAKFIKHEAHTSGIDNPLNKAVQDACKTDGNKEIEDMYSEYQDFKHAGNDADIDEDSGNYNTYTPNNSGGDTGNYNDFTPNNAIASKQKIIQNSKGQQRPQRPRPPPRATPSNESDAPSSGYMDLPPGGHTAEDQQSSSGYMDLPPGGHVAEIHHQQQSPARPPQPGFQAPGIVAPVDESQNYLEIPVGGAKAQPQGVDESQNYLEIPVGGAKSQQPQGVDESQNYLEIPVGGAKSQEKEPQGVDESENYLEIPVGGAQAKKDEDPGDSTSSSSEDES